MADEEKRGLETDIGAIIVTIIEMVLFEGY